MLLKRLFICALAVSSITFSYANLNLELLPSKADSLLKALADQEADTAKVLTLNRLAQALQNTYPDSSRLYVDEAILLATELGDEPTLALSYNQRGIVHYYRGSLNDAANDLETASQLYNKLEDAEGIANSLNNLGVISYEQGHLNTALERYLSSLKFMEQLNSEDGVAMALNNIGNVYKELKNFPKAIEHYRKAYQMQLQLQDTMGISMALNNLGLVDMEQRNYKDALSNFKAAAVMSELANNQHGLAMNLANIGDLHSELEEFEKADGYYQKALLIREELQDEMGMSEMHLSRGRLHERAGDMDLAIADYQKGLEHAEASGSQMRCQDLLSALTDAFEKKGDLAKAFLYQKKYLNIHDSITSADSKDRIDELHKQFEQEHTKALELAAQKDVADQHAQAMGSMRNVAVAILVFVVLLTTAVWYRIRQRSRNNEMLEKLSVVASKTDNYVVITDKDDRVTWLNDGFTRILGFTMEDMKGKVLGQMLRGKDTSKEQVAVIQQHVAEKRPFTGEILNYTKDGEPVWLSMNVTPVLDDKQEVEKFICIGNDVSQKKNSDEKIRLNNKRMDIISSVDRSILRSDTLNDVIFNALDQLMDKLPLCFTSIHIYAEDARSYDDHAVTTLTGKLERFHLPDQDIQFVPGYRNLMDKQVHVINDLSKKEGRSETETQLVEVGVRSILLVPLVFEDRTIGSLNIGSLELAAFGKEITGLLKELANTISFSINQNKLQEQLRTNNEQLLKKNKDITDSINYAKRIQEANLPNISTLKMHFPDSFIFNKPKDIVSGDFYWYHRVGNKVVVAVADCTGHGVPGGFITMLGINLLNNIVKEQGLTNPAEIMEKLHRQLQKSIGRALEEQDLRDGMDISICVIDQVDYNIQFAGARRPLLFHNGMEMKRYKGNKLSIADSHQESTEAFKVHEFYFKKGDRIYMFSDGFADQFGGPSNKKFTSVRFRQLLEDSAFQEMEKQKALLEQTLEEWQGELEQIDDILVLGLSL